MRFGKKSRKQKSSALVLLNDAKVQKELGRAVEAVRDASSALSAAASTKRGRGQGQLVLSGAILGLIAAVGVAFVWRSKLRSVPETDDQVSPHSSAETDDPSATTASPTSPSVSIEMPRAPAGDTSD